METSLISIVEQIKTLLIGYNENERYSDNDLSCVSMENFIRRTHYRFEMWSMDVSQPTKQFIIVDDGGTLSVLKNSFSVGREEIEMYINDTKWS